MEAEHEAVGAESRRTWDTASAGSRTLDKRERFITRDCNIFTSTLTRVMERNESFERAWSAGESGS